MDGAGGTGAGGFDDGGLGPGSFERWLAEVRVDEAAKARARRHWIRTAAQEDATFAGVLLDLAERQVPVALTTTTGRRHHGIPAVVGDGFVALRTGGQRHVLIRLDVVTTVRPATDAPASVGDRDVASERTMLDVLVALAEDRAPATLSVGTDVVAGEVRSVGQDVVALRTDADPPATLYVAVASIEELALDGPPGQSLTAFESG